MKQFKYLFGILSMLFGCWLSVQPVYAATGDVTVHFDNNGADNPEWQKKSITVGDTHNDTLTSSLFWYKRGFIFSS